MLNTSNTAQIPILIYILKAPKRMYNKLPKLASNLTKSTGDTIKYMIIVVYSYIL